jgi:outer membrane protein TolC
VVIAAAAHQESLPPPQEPAPASGVLSREGLIAEVEARNPSLAAMVAAWQAAAQRYPQAVALDDPMFMGLVAPDSVSSDLVDTGYMLDVQQKLPWFGKRRLRGAVAAAEADAAFQDSADTRLQVRLAAETAFLEYFLAHRLARLNRENTRIMEQFRETAQTKYQTNQVTQQDVLQADVELAELARRQFELDRMQKVAIARINTLLRQLPDAPLPPPPMELGSPGELPDADLAWQTALQQRPDLAALAWRVESEEAGLALAYKNFYPDVNVIGRYDATWQEIDLRAQVGVQLNMPIYREKLRSAVREAEFRVNQRRAEFDQQALEIQYEVMEATRRVEESRRVVELYAQRLVPVAEQNLAAARSNYEVNKLNFLDLAMAQKQLVNILEDQQQAVVSLHQRMAELRRAVGGP